MYKASKDDLTNWTLHTAISGFWTIAVSANDGSAIFRSSTGLYRTTDNGVTRTLVTSIGNSTSIIYNDDFGYVAHDGYYNFRFSKDGIAWISADLKYVGTHNIGNYRDISDSHPDYIVVGSMGCGSFSSYIRFSKTWDGTDVPEIEYFESSANGFNASYRLYYFMYRAHSATLDLFTTSTYLKVGRVYKSGILSSCATSSEMIRVTWAIRIPDTNNFVMCCQDAYPYATYQSGVWRGIIDGDRTQTLVGTTNAYRAYC